MDVTLNDWLFVHPSGLSRLQSSGVRAAGERSLGPHLGSFDSITTGAVCAARSLFSGRAACSEGRFEPSRGDSASAEPFRLQGYSDLASVEPLHGSGAVGSGALGAGDFLVQMAKEERLDGDEDTSFSRREVRLAANDNAVASDAEPPSFLVDDRFEASPRTIGDTSAPPSWARQIIESGFARWGLAAVLKDPLTRSALDSLTPDRPGPDAPFDEGLERTLVRAAIRTARATAQPSLPDLSADKGVGDVARIAANAAAGALVGFPDSPVWMLFDFHRTFAESVGAEVTRPAFETSADRFGAYLSQCDQAVAAAATEILTGATPRGGARALNGCVEPVLVSIFTAGLANLVKRGLFSGSTASPGPPTATSIVKKEGGERSLVVPSASTPWGLEPVPPSVPSLPIHHSMAGDDPGESGGDPGGGAGGEDRHVPMAAPSSAPSSTGDSAPRIGPGTDDEALSRLVAALNAAQVTEGIEEAAHPLASALTEFGSPAKVSVHDGRPLVQVTPSVFVDFEQSGSASEERIAENPDTPDKTFEAVLIDLETLGAIRTEIGPRIKPITLTVQAGAALGEDWLGALSGSGSLQLSRRDDDAIESLVRSLIPEGHDASGWSALLEPLKKPRAWLGKRGWRLHLVLSRSATAPGFIARRSLYPRSVKGTSYGALFGYFVALRDIRQFDGATTVGFVEPHGWGAGLGTKGMAALQNVIGDLYKIGFAWQVITQLPWTEQAIAWLFGIDEQVIKNVAEEVDGGAKSIQDWFVEKRKAAWQATLDEFNNDRWLDYLDAAEENRNLRDSIVKDGK